MTTVEKGMTLHRYWDRASCTGCRLKPQCTPSVERRITRWEQEALLDALQARMNLAPLAMRTRRRLVEHRFGTIKAWMGHTHFLMKRRPNVKTEISLHIPAYNMKRVMAVLGTKPLMEAIRAQTRRSTPLRRRGALAAQRAFTRPRSKRTFWRSRPGGPLAVGQSMSGSGAEQPPPRPMPCG